MSCNIQENGEETKKKKLSDRLLFLDSEEETTKGGSDEKLADSVGETGVRFHLSLL